jgi:hypothetical protein
MAEARRSSGSPRNKTTDGSSEAALWGRLFDPAGNKLPPEVAQYILGLGFPERDVDHLHALAQKARAGTTSLEEQIELDNYERVGHMLSIMKSKARKALKKRRAET